MYTECLKIALRGSKKCCYLFFHRGIRNKNSVGTGMAIVIYPFSFNLVVHTETVRSFQPVL